MLSREATITLHAPRHIGTPTPDGFLAPRQQWLAGSWHITNTTHPGRPGSSILISPYQEEAYRTVTGTETTLINLQPDSPTVNILQDKATGREWEILASGKEGQLEPWMSEDGSGWIADSSGEVRADWRNSYLVFYVTPGDGDEKRGDFEILICERFGPSRPLSDKTIGKIRDALKGVCDEKFGDLVGQLRIVVGE